MIQKTVEVKRVLARWACIGLVGVFWALVIWAVLSFFGAKPAHAFTDAQAIHAILGEARGEGYDGMYAVACAIRNRGTLNGVDGAKVWLGDIDGRLYQTAARAWAESEAGPDPTHGADHWYAHGIKKPWWAKYGKRTAVIRGHTFMKDVKAALSKIKGANRGA